MKVRGHDLQHTPKDTASPLAHKITVQRTQLNPCHIFSSSLIHTSLPSLAMHSFNVGVISLPSIHLPSSYSLSLSLSLNWLPICILHICLSFLLLIQPPTLNSRTALPQKLTTEERQTDTSYEGKLDRGVSGYSPLRILSPFPVIY